MSLQVWLPLTKDLRQQGLSDVNITTTNASFIDTGKLGHCLKLGYTNDFNIPSMVNKKQISLAYWIKLNTATATDWLDVIRFYTSDGTSSIQNRQEFYTNCSLSGFFYDGGDSSGIGYGAIVAGEWYHFTTTIDYATGEIKTYRNGGLLHTKYNANVNAHITGSFRLGESGLDISMNDVRIYDHCLSPMEVKELSKGLVLHYPLNRQGWGQENLLLNTNDLTKWSKESTCTITLENDGYYHIVSTNTNGSRYGIYYDLTFPEVGTYTLSADVRTDWRIGFAASSSFGWTSNTVTGTGNAQHIIKTITTTSENNKCRIYINSQMNSSGVVTNSTYIKNIKVEKGSIPTPWCPNSSDTLAITMGLNSNIEYDASGFNNNGTRTGSFSWASDAPKYKVSTAITASNSKITSPRLFSRTQSLTSDYTVALWAKLDSNATQISRIYNGICALNFQPSGPYISYSYSTSSNSTTGSSKTITTDVWLHMAMVYSQTNATITIYFDGKKHYTYTNISTAYACEAQETLFGSNPPGLVSDVRVYATALSADDIKSLYQNEAQLDASGNVIGPIR